MAHGTGTALVPRPVSAPRSPARPLLTTPPHSSGCRPVSPRFPPLRSYSLVLMLAPPDPPAQAASLRADPPQILLTPPTPCPLLSFQLRPALAAPFLTTVSSRHRGLCSRPRTLSHTPTSADDCPPCREAPHG
ncbi:hypothetical protein B0H17DRAFT_1200178 [Mycena rosella]|uniref:Uncharacterized protein n=1 Tax=Mycena rosella TaxID=1033263 RepID=A0AAD7GFS4_MYCRO|nr:hypothetical protein B0H17DRAFT_1200178 [Mycena rosella]